MTSSTESAVTERQWERSLALIRAWMRLANLRKDELQLAQAEIRFLRAKLSKLERANAHK